MKYLFTLVSFLVLSQISSAQVDFYVGNQLLDNSLVYQFVSSNSTPMLHLKIENTSGSVQVLTADVCVIQDVPEWSVNSLEWGIKTINLEEFIF